MAEPKEGYNSGITRVVSSGAIDSSGNYVTGGAASVYLKSAESGLILPSHGFSYDWILGDDSNTVTIAASGSQASPAIDMTGYDMTHSTLEVVVGGTGTGKVNIQGSRDGVSDLVDLGDRITGMVAGSSPYHLRLDDTNLAYFPFYVFTFTETGGANAVTIKAIVMGQSNDV